MDMHKVEKEIFRTLWDAIDHRIEPHKAIFFCFSLIYACLFDSSMILHFEYKLDLNLNIEGDSKVPVTCFKELISKATLPFF